MEQPRLSADSHVVLLLASHLGGDSSSGQSDGGLGPAGWQDFAAEIADSELDSPSELLELPSDGWPDGIWTSEATRGWVAERLDRATQLAMEIEDLNNRGIWVTTQYEETYPDRLAQDLGRKAPPFLYVAGDAENLDERAVGFVGSRDVDETDRDTTRRLVAKIMDDGFGVVSGGARGIDETSEAAGLEHGGPVIEFPVEGLHRCLQDGTVREAVMAGDFTLVSHYHPKASWNVGAAMGRNKLIHGFGRYTVVVRSGDGDGGTWAGATENLEHGWSPLLVCTPEETPPGNRALIERGGIPIDPTEIPDSERFEDWVDAARQRSPDAGRDEEEEEDATHDERSGEESGSAGDRQSSLDQF